MTWWPWKRIHPKELYQNKSLKNFTNQELIGFLNCNEHQDLQAIGAICSEILRRMNEIKPLLEDK